ncbi:MAG: hypothetical protein K2H62_04515, partial [Bacteroidales bacterium]|nr:hypothetical protein [Bacteroidales bacterium]
GPMCLSFCDMDDYKENKVEAARRQIFGFAPLMDALPLRSAAARRAIWTLPWYGPAEAGALQAELARQRAYGALAQRADERALAHFKRHLEQTPDLRPTFRQLREERGALDDIQLFELKNWLLPMGESARFARASGIDLAPLPDLEAALDLLDPLKERLPSFYIYDCYDERLPQLRRALKTAAEAASAGRTASAGEPVAGRENGADPCGGGSSINIEEQLSETELAVREELSRRLRGFVDDLEAALDGLVAWDFLIAKTEWAEAQHCRCPEILTGADADDAPALAYTGLFYPPLFQQCQAQGRPYQAVDIALDRDACLLTGANMSGKTILIKALALAQTLAQFGFFVPAAAARLTLFDEVCRIVGDGQNESRGLSSFGAEILSLHETLQKLRQGRRILFLADELARTTNPTEGSAIVCAFFDLWRQLRSAALTAGGFGSAALISTHYEHVDNAPRRLRVKGLDTARWAAACQDRAAIRAGEANGQTADFLAQLQNFMDYGVEEVLSDSPAEMQALDVAACLGVDADLIAAAKRYGH